MQPVLQQHDDRLQSLRGLAALCVAVGHAALLIDCRFGRAMSAVFPAGSAVLLFYVLSGFVLGESLRRRKSGVGEFAIRRAARLLPVFWLSILAALPIDRLMEGRALSGESAWFDYFLSIGTGPGAVPANLLGLSHALNPVLWSIQVELWIIPVLPALAALCDRLSFRQNVGVLAALTLVSFGLLRVLAFDSLIRNVAFGWCFYLGLMMPQILRHRGLSPFLGNGWLIVAELVALTALQWAINNGAQHISTAKTVLDSYVGAHIIAWLMLHPRPRLFAARPVIWLGDISYSFYAFSLMILVLAAFLMFAVSPTPWWTSRPAAFILLDLAVSLPITLWVAHLSYAWIERPGMRMGSLILDWRRRRTAARALP